MRAHSVLRVFIPREISSDEVKESDLSDSSSKTEINAELKLLQKHISKLKPEYQDVLILKHVEGLSVKEISEIVSKNPNIVRVTIHRAMNALKKIYS